MRSSLLRRQGRGQRPCFVAQRPSRALTVRPVAASANFYDASQRFCSSLTNACPYKVLGVSPTSSETEIKAAFRLKVKEHHPDVSKDPLAHLHFMDCQKAYQTLLDPEARAKYDRSLQPKASSQALEYLNARSAARYGLPRTPRAPVDNELHKTMLELLQQVKSCTKYLERELTAHAPGARAARASQQTVVPPTQRIAVPTECTEDGECCEPWLYYAAVPATTRQDSTGGTPPRRR